MKRYRIGCPGCGSMNPSEIHGGDCKMVHDIVTTTPADDGEWVRYEDVTDTQLFKHGVEALEDAKDFYRLLIKKYIYHVQCCEGVSFLRDSDRDKYSDFPNFSDEEWKLLKALKASIEP